MTSTGRHDGASRGYRFRHWAGLDALATIWPAASEPIRYPHGDESEALRSDFIHIGRDLRGVIEREAAREPIKPD